MGLLDKLTGEAQRQAELEQQKQRDQAEKDRQAEADKKLLAGIEAEQKREAAKEQLGQDREREAGPGERMFSNDPERAARVREAARQKDEPEKEQEQEPEREPTKMEYQPAGMQAVPTIAGPGQASKRVWKLTAKEYDRERERSLDDDDPRWG